MDVMIVHEAQLRAQVGMDRDSLQCIAECFGWLQDGRAMVPPVVHIEAADRHGEIDIKTAYVKGLGRLAVKIASGFPGLRFRRLVEDTQTWGSHGCFWRHRLYSSGWSS